MWANLGHGTRRPAPGKLLAIEKWEEPTTITSLRAFLGFTNYYNTYIHMYAEVTARLQEKLKVPREVGKKGSTQRVYFDEEDKKAFGEVKKRLCSALVLQRVSLCVKSGCQWVCGWCNPRTTQG